MGASSSSSSNSGSSSGTKKGEDWTFKIYFDPDADKSSGAFYEIEDSELIEKLTDLVDADEDIINIRAYKQKLWSWQLTQLLFCHMFIMFETDDWWWSIEKNSEGITIQRSKKIEAVKEQYRRTKRNTIKLMEEDKGRKSMLDLINWLYKENELNKKYDYVSSNCKHFAKAVFDHVAKNKFL